ncbi:MAG: trigger factor family protein, partial [Deltaproteobacteria bacterium]|nr:trigger factor family protein [Deltaproteobacteria bacterium]
MKLVQTEDISPVIKKLTVEVDDKAATKALDKAYRNLAKKARIKGFRPGKAPRSILERYYGSRVLQEVAGDLISASLEEAIEESGLKPVVQP